MNSVQLIGRLTRDIDLKFTTNGTPVGQFTLAVNRKYTNANGEREADFVNCVIWRKAAENFANFTHKGSQVGIEGRLQTRNYENQHGQRVYVTEVLVDSFTLLETRKQKEEYQSNNANQTPNDAPANYKTNEPSQNYNSAPTHYQPPSPYEGGPVNISEDDLPF